MKLYSIEFRSDSEEAKRMYKAVQLYNTIRKAKQRMKEMFEELSEEYPLANRSFVDKENRAHVWVGQDTFDAPPIYEIANIRIREIKVH